MKCQLCEGDGGDLLWRDGVCRVVHVDEAGYPGFYRAIWNAHVREMTDLAEAERVRFMRVVFELEAGLREQLRPDKINLASLGNVTPHLHWHVIARFHGDPHFPNPVWGARLRPSGKSGVDLANLKHALAKRLAQLATAGGPMPKT